MAAEITRLFPGCPAERALSIARHAAARGSGRVGRSLQLDAVELAVTASVRNQDTRYDELLMAGLDRAAARAEVRDAVAQVLSAWRQAPAGGPVR
jgi:hypothetical protein